MALLVIKLNLHLVKAIEIGVTAIIFLLDTEILCGMEYAP